MNEIAYVINPIHFKVQEFNFALVKDYTNNIILEYEIGSPVDYYKRSIFELSRLGFNFGILIIDNIEPHDIKQTEIELLLDNIRNFNVYLGVWISSKNLDNQNNIYDYLSFYYNKNFIIGIKDSDIDNVYKWGPNGDIEDRSLIMLDFVNSPIQTIKLNTDIKTIYIENNMEPLKP